MNLTGLIFLLFAHYFTGRGIVRLFRVEMTAVALFCFSLICGVTVHSMVPCIMELLHVPITVPNMYAWLAGSAVLFSIPLLLNIKQTKMPRLELPQLYELPFILIFLGLAAVSVWRCWYFPPTPRDVLTGTELIAEFTVKEHTMRNSVFSVDYRLNGAANNMFKSPFITGLQVIYKMLVLPFGQLWLSVLFIAFTTWLYTLIRSIVHPLLAGILMLIYFAIPDLFAYTYIILYDYSNMIFFFAGFYFMMRYLDNDRMNELLWVTFLFGMATYIRSETLVLAAVVVVLMAWYQYRAKMPLKKIAIRAAVFMAGPLLFNFILSNVFIRNLVPAEFKLGDLLNHDMTNVSELFARYKELLMDLMFSSKGEQVFAHFYIFFLAVLGIDIVATRKFSKDGGLALWGVLVVFLTLGLLCFLIPSHTVINSAKRGLFKLIPLMVLYMAHSGILQKLSAYLRRKEEAATQKGTVAAAPAERATPAPKQVKGKK
ncbi:hypothetical protein GCM10023093_29770 [Nemorincola caseinilytica]|uniref:Glycosyltransferase RgtA/B/C/D-like domain-containing protein n=1 Tax=Nemorincola caseinilytica TaxID=2054315 RepID=A0ABP8NN11_9BACT